LNRKWALYFNNTITTAFNPVKPGLAPRYGYCGLITGPAGEHLNPMCDEDIFVTYASLALSSLSMPHLIAGILLILFVVNSLITRLSGLLVFFSTNNIMKT